jgi:osmotically-inducible protein OsmY
MRTDTHAERNHKIVAAIVVAVMAAAGIGAVVFNANHHVTKHTARAAAPAAAFPDTLAPQASQANGDATTGGANPPPLTNSAASDSATNGAAGAADSAAQSTAPATGSSPPAANSATPPATSPPSSSPPAASSSGPAAGPRHTSDARDSGASNGATNMASSDNALRYAPTGEAAVVTASSRLEADGSTAFGNGRMLETSAQVPSSLQARAAGADAANADRRITRAVQSQIAEDTLSQRSTLDVTTINGVVILTGTVANPDVVQHVKEVVQQVRDVRGVDATAVQVSAI